MVECIWHLFVLINAVRKCRLLSTSNFMISAKKHNCARGLNNLTLRGSSRKESISIKEKMTTMLHHEDLFEIHRNTWPLLNKSCLMQQGSYIDRIAIKYFITYHTMCADWSVGVVKSFPVWRDVTLRCKLIALISVMRHVCNIYHALTRCITAGRKAHSRACLSTPSSVKSLSLLLWNIFCLSQPSRRILLHCSYRTERFCSFC